MTFADQSWPQRFARMGDEAEAMFEATYPHGFTRYGLNRPDINVANLPLVIRYTPDYLGANEFIEVKGVGKDQKLKLKLDQLFALQWWQAILPARVFIWDSYNKRHVTLDLTNLRRTCEQRGVLAQFPEGKPIFELHCSALSDAGWVYGP